MIFLKFVKAHEIKVLLIKPIWVEASLGEPSIKFTTNDAESENFIIKYGLHFDKSFSQQVFHQGFLQCMWLNPQEIRNEKPYFLCIEGLRKFNIFRKATMNDKEKFVEEHSSQCFSKQG